MSRWPDDRQWAGVCGEIEDLVVRLRRDGPAVIRRARIGARDGFGTSSPGFARAGSGGGTGDPTGETATMAALADPVREAGLRMVTAVNRAVREIRAADDARRRVAEDGGGLAGVGPIGIAGEGDCGCCRRYVSGSRVDRLRAGYCQACYAAWCRAGRPERGGFEIRRRQQLAAEGAG